MTKHSLVWEKLVCTLNFWEVQVLKTLGALLLLHWLFPPLKQEIDDASIQSALRRKETKLVIKDIKSSLTTFLKMPISENLWRTKQVLHNNRKAMVHISLGNNYRESRNYSLFKHQRILSDLLQTYTMPGTYYKYPKIYEIHKSRCNLGNWIFTNFVKSR